MKRLGNRGQLWNMYLGGLAVLIAFGFIYVILNQTWISNFKPMGLSRGADLTTMNYLVVAWVIVPAIPVIAWVFSTISAGKKLAGGGGQYD
jgi:hypothetical protein